MKMNHKRIILSGILIFILINSLKSEDGYRLWLRYDLISNRQKLNEYNSRISQIVIPGNSATIIAAKEELINGLTGLLGRNLEVSEHISKSGAIIAGTPQNSAIIAKLNLEEKLKAVGNEGFIIQNILTGGNRCIAIAASTDIGIFIRSLRIFKINSDGKQYF